MPKYDIVVLTSDKYNKSTPLDSDETNVLLEDKLIVEALKKKGFKVLRTSWSDKNFDWTSTKAVLIRTTWDYFHRFDEFNNWLEDIKNKCTIINPYDTVRWNIDKHYLLDLQEAGINIPETVFIESGETKTLEQLFTETGWKEVVLKPAVSGAGRHTYRLTIDNIKEHEKIFAKLLEKESMMFQNFQKNVLSKGEVAYMFMGNKFTHAILKVAKKGDFRVQDDFGGTVEEYFPSQEEIYFARKVVENCERKTYFARVDAIYDNNSQLAVSELELIEPELWFRYKPSAADELANFIASDFDKLN